MGADPWSSHWDPIRDGGADDARTALTVFLDRCVEALPAVFNLQSAGDGSRRAASHLTDAQLVGDRELGRHVAAAYTPEHGGRIFWKGESARLVGVFLSRQYLGWPEKDQLAFLGVLKSELGILFHEMIHAVGPADPATFEGDFLRDVRDQGITAAKEGLTELIAEHFLDRWLEVVGLIGEDPRLATVTGVDFGAYPGQVTAMRRIVEASARANGRSLDSELHQVVRDGCGSRAHDRLGRSLLRLQGLGNDAAAIGAADRLLRGELWASRQEFDQMLRTAPSSEKQVAAGLRWLREQGAKHGDAVIGGIRRLRLPSPQDPRPWNTEIRPRQRPRVLEPGSYLDPRLQPRRRVVVVVGL